MKNTFVFLISVIIVGSSLLTIAQSVRTKPETKGQKTQIFIGSDWPLGKVILHDGSMIDNYLFRYNFLTDKMQYIFGRDTLTFMNPMQLNTVSFGGHTFVYENFQFDSVSLYGYFELLVPGKNKLMLRRFVTSQKPDSKSPDDESLTKYKVEECYYIGKPGMPANKIACNRKSALTFLNDHNEDIAEYLRITGNKVRTIDDLKLLVSYYNSLDEE